MRKINMVASVLNEAAERVRLYSVYADAQLTQKPPGRTAFGCFAIDDAVLAHRMRSHTVGHCLRDVGLQRTAIAHFRNAAATRGADLEVTTWWSVKQSKPRIASLQAAALHAVTHPL